MKESKTKCCLNTCMLCKLCLPDWKSVISLNKKNIEIKKGEQVFKEGDPVKGIYFIYEGKVKVHKKWAVDKDLILRFAKKGDMIGHLGIGNDLYYPVNATALEPTVACFFDTALFESSLSVNHDYTYSLMKFFANELQEYEKRMRNLAHMPVKERIAQAFLSLKKQFGIDPEGYVNIEITRQDLSSYASVAYETFFKVSQEFIHAGFIEFNGKRIRIKSDSLLERLSEESHL